MRKFKVNKYFLKSIKNKSTKIKNKIYDAIDEITTAYFEHDIDILKSYDFEIIANKMRFYFSRSDRIHAILKDDYLLFYGYYNASEHDESIKESYRIKNENINGVDTYEKEAYKYKDVDVIEIPKEVLNLDIGKYFMYELDDIQKKYKEDMYLKPIIVTGNAGSGKTTISIDCILKILNSKQKLKVGYFTYNESLKNEVLNTINNYIEDNSVDFYAFTNNDICRNVCKERPISFEKFCDWYHNCKLSFCNKYQIHLLYSEIKNIIKGYSGINFDSYSFYKNRAKLMSKEEYINFLAEYDISKEDRQNIYTLAENYQSWLIENNLYDENDIALLIKENKNKKKYDYIIIDEVQDLTEIQFLMILSFINKENYSNLMICGDIHQSITNYQFDFKRIRSYFYNNYSIKTEPLNLTYNYRNSEEVVNFVNELKKLRKEYIGSKKLIEESLDESRRTNELKAVMLSIINKQNLSNIVENIKGTDTIYITFNDDDSKKLINTVEGIDVEDVFTIYEAKGREFENVIIYNFLSKENLRNFKNAQIDPKVRSIYRQEFNKLYTAVTRTKDSLMLCEEHIPEDWQDIIKKYFNEVNTFEECGFIEISDMYSYAKSNEDNLDIHNIKMLKYVKNQYKKAKSVEDVNRLDIIIAYNSDDIKCAKELEKYGYNNSAAKFYLSAGLPEKALIMYFVENDYNNLKKVAREYNINLYDLLMQSKNISILTSYKNKINKNIENMNNIIEVIKNGQ